MGGDFGGAYDTRNDSLISVTSVLAHHTHRANVIDIRYPRIKYPQ
jgi:hypothetical protein